RVTRPAHAQSGLMAVPDKLDQLARVPEPSVDGLKFRLSFWRVTTQRQNVFDARFADFLENRRQIIPRGTDARKVGHGLDTVLPFDAGHDLDRALARGTASAVSY